MKNFRTFNLSVAFYKEASTVPLPRHLSDQLKRAAVSAPLNLAEGRGRSSKVDQKRFFSIAFGSVRECQAILLIADLKDSPLWSLLDKLAASLYVLIKKWA
jgi:four helix bundle protein